MGVSFKDLVKKEELDISQLKGKILAVDAHNMLYQFITTIRERDGTPLKDSKGNVTSHLIGLFSRVTNFMSKGLKLVFVYDGKPPKLKQTERDRRYGLKVDAQSKYEAAKQEEDIDGMKKYGARTARLTAEMIEDSKMLLDALGVPYIVAPSEGDAQAAYLVKKGDAYATISQDFDTLMHGSNKLVRNLSIAGRRRKGATSIAIKPEIIILADVLNELGLTRDQLIVLGILIGTDYNYGGIKGIGPKKALKLLKEHGNDYETIFESVEWKNHFDFSWQLVFDTIKDMPVTNDYEIRFKTIDADGVFSLLCERFEFSRERVNSSLSKLLSRQEEKKQKGLSDFF